MNLYSGRLGPILFLAYLGELAQIKKYRGIAELSLKGLVASIDTEIPFNQLGFSGWGGYIYALSSLKTIWASSELNTYINHALKSITTLISKDVLFDIITGNAGCILSLLTLAEHVEYKVQAIELASTCADSLMEAAIQSEDGLYWPILNDEKPLLGFSHENAGISLALSKLGEITNNSLYRDAGMASISYENTFYNSNEQNWPDLRGGDINSFMSTWCHGAAGITLSRCLGDQKITENMSKDLDACIYQLSHHKKLNNHSLCHGMMGNLDILHTIATTTKQPALLNEFNIQLTEIAKDVTERGWLSAIPSHQLQPGLMDSLSGMGYSLLKFSAPQIVPNILALSPPIK